jgi:hypothetical protein|tara:strand:- start:3889 stop:4164 length:276 start_codon:yes stop_codon:yes gene_type:complete
MAEEEKPVPEIDINKMILLLKQTKLIPQKEISVFKMILKKMNNGLKISLKHKQIYNDIVTRAAVDPMSNNMSILSLTRNAIKKKAKAAGGK